MRKVAIEILMMIVVREESRKNRRVWVFEEKTVSELMLLYSVFHFNHAVVFAMVSRETQKQEPPEE